MSYMRSGSNVRMGNPRLGNKQLREKNIGEANLIGEMSLPDYVAGVSRPPNMNLLKNQQIKEQLAPKTDYEDRDANMNTEHFEGGSFKSFMRGVGHGLKKVADVAKVVAPLAPLIL